MELPPLPLALIRPAAGSGLTARRRSVPPGILLRGSLPISAGELDLELVELIPLGIGPLPFRNCLKLLQAGTRGYRLRFIHRGIISLVGVPYRHCSRRNKDRRNRDQATIPGQTSRVIAGFPSRAKSVRQEVILTARRSA